MRDGVEKISIVHKTKQNVGKKFRFFFFTKYIERMFHMLRIQARSKIKLFSSLFSKHVSKNLL